VAGFSCTIGGNTFSDFRATISTVNFGGGTVQPATLSDITVVPGGTTLQSTFNLAASYLATSPGGANDHVNLSFIFTAVADPAFAFRQLDAAVSDAATTGGAVAYSSGVCLAGTYNLSAIPICNTTEAGDVSNLVDAISSPASSTSFLHTTNLDVGSRFLAASGIVGSASASNLSFTLSADSIAATDSPEPRQIALTGSLLLLMAISYRRAKS